MEMIKKFNWRWLMMLAAVMMMGVTMTACGDDDDDDDDNAARSAVGVWAWADALGSGDNNVEAIQLRSDGTGYDGTWNVREKKFTASEDMGTWEYDGETMYLYPEDAHAYSFRFEISDDGKYAVQYIDGDVIAYVKVQ